MIRTSQRLRLASVLALALLVSGCSIWEGVTDTVSDWFAASSKSKLRGERIPLEALDSALKPDPDHPEYAGAPAGALSQHRMA